MIDLYELTPADLRTWDDVLADDTPPAYPADRCFWLCIGRYEQPIRKAA